MKKKHLCIPCLCAVFCIVIVFMAGAAKNPEIKTVEQLLQKRTAIMENILLGKITYDEGKLRLREVETGSLYRTDLNGIMDSFDTDIESVVSMNIVFLEKKGQVCDIINFEGKIIWTCAGYDGEYVKEGIYSIGVSCKGGEYRLVSLEIQ